MNIQHLITTIYFLISPLLIIAALIFFVIAYFQKSPMAFILGVVAAALFVARLFG